MNGITMLEMVVLYSNSKCGDKIIILTFGGRIVARAGLWECSWY